MTADVENAVNIEVEITTSTGLHFTSQTNMGKVSYQFEDDLPAGTTITVKADNSTGSVDVPGITGLSFTRADGVLVGKVVGTKERNVSIEASYGFSSTIVANANGTFRTVLTGYGLDGFNIIATVAGAPTNLDVDPIEATLSDVTYHLDTNSVTGKTNRESVRVITSTNVDVMVPVVNGEFNYAFPAPLKNGDLITVFAGNLHEQIVVEIPEEAYVTDLAYDSHENVVSGKSNQPTVDISTSAGVNVTGVAVVNGAFSYRFTEQVTSGTDITVRAGNAEATLHVNGQEKPIANYAFDAYENGVSGSTNAESVFIEFSYGYSDRVDVVDGVFKYVHFNRINNGVTITASTVLGERSSVVTSGVVAVTNAAYDHSANLITADVSLESTIRIVTTKGTAEIESVNGKIEYSPVDGQIPSGDEIVFFQGVAEAARLLVEYAPETTLENVTFDNVSNALTGQSNADKVHVVTSDGFEVDVDVNGGYFYYAFVDLLAGDTTITVIANSVSVNVMVETYLENIDYYPRDNVLYGQSNQKTVLVTSSKGQEQTVETNNGNFDCTFNERLVEGDTVTVKAGKLEQTLTIPPYELGDQITDVEFHAETNSVTGKTAAPTVTIRLSSGEVYRDVPVTDGEFNFKFPTRLDNGLQIEISEPKGETATTYTSGVASVTVITYDHRSNQILADLSMSNKITLKGPFQAVELTATNGKVGHIPEVILQGNDVIEFYQGEFKAAEYTIPALTNVIDDFTDINDGDITVTNGSGEVQLYVNLGRVRYNYASISWEVTGSDDVTIDSDGKLTVNVNIDTPIVIKSIADGHVTTSNATIRIGALS